MNIPYVVILFIILTMFSFTNAIICEEPGCYNTQVHPCSWVDNICSFQFDYIIYTCVDIPANGTMTVSCETTNGHAFSLSICDQSQYLMHIDGIPHVRLNDPGHSIMDTTTKTWSGSTDILQNLHTSIEIQDRNTCNTIKCTIISSDPI
jgi:hypothetical protein